MTTSLTILISLLGLLLLVMGGTRILLKLYSRAHTRDSWTPIPLMFMGGGVLTTAGPNMIASLFGDSSSIDNHTVFLGLEWAIIATSAVVAVAGPIVLGRRALHRRHDTRSLRASRARMSNHLLTTAKGLWPLVNDTGATPAERTAAATRLKDIMTKLALVDEDRTPVALAVLENTRARARELAAR